MPSKVSINGHGASVTLEVFGYENPFAKNNSDANWLKCRVATNVGQFTGNYDASFTTSDFARFRDGLKTLLTSLSGSASFDTDEETLKCAIEMRKAGTAVIKGVARIRGQTMAALSFSFDSDQSFLVETLHEVEGVVAEYPMKK